MNIGEERYFNFPVTLLQDAFYDIRSTMNNIMNYAGYARAKELSRGDKTKRMNDAGDYLEIEFGNALQSFKNGKILFESTPPNSPMTGINSRTCFDFFNNHKTEFKIAVLLAFLAFKSIIGNKKYSCITNNFLLSRMGGFSSTVGLDKLPETLIKYSTRWKLDKIKVELCDKWNLAIYGYRIKGFYCSLKLTTEGLAEVAEEKRFNYKLKKHKGQQAEARKKAIENLYKKLTSNQQNKEVNNDTKTAT